MSVDAKSLVLGVVVGSAVTATVGFVLHKREMQSVLDGFDERLTAEVKSEIDHMRSKGIDLNEVVIDDNLDDENPEADEIPLKVSIEPAKMAPDSDKSEKTEVVSSLAQTLEKPPLEDLISRNNQRMAYHKIIEDAAYSQTDETMHTEEDEPYEDPDITVIGQELFISNVSEFDQESLTYYADGGVVDDQGGLVADHVTLIGSGTPKFGLQSNDPQIVYLRNKRLKKEFEVIQDPGNSTDFLPPAEKPDEGESLQHSMQVLKDYYNGSDERR